MSIRLAGLAGVLALGLACAGNPSNEAGQSGAAAPGAAEPVGGVAAGVAAADAPAATAAAAEVRKPSFEEVTVPSGTVINLSLTTPVSSDGSKVEDVVRATVTKPVVVAGKVAIPAGAELVGNVLEADPSGRVKGRASVAFRFNRLNLKNDVIDITTARISREAAPTKKEDAKKIGIGAGAGAVIGAIAGGKKGAAIGAAAGGGAGTGVVLATKGDEVRLGVGAPVRATLDEPVKINIPQS